MNIIRSQSLDGSVPPKRRPAVSKRGMSSMPTLLRSAWRISKVSCRSWLPVVVKKRKDSRPTPGQEKMLVLLSLGVLGPPVQPFFLSVEMTLAGL